MLNMKTIDISSLVSQKMQHKKRKEFLELDQRCQQNWMPAWMKTAYDDFIHDESSASTTNIIHIDFSRPKLEIPKALAASSIGAQQRPWYEQGVISYRDIEGALLNITFNKDNHSDSIDITVSVVGGNSTLLQGMKGQSDILCSLVDHNSELARLSATVDINGTFLYAEGQVIEDYEPEESSDNLSLIFH